MTKREKEELTSIIDELYDAQENDIDDIEILDRLYLTVKEMIDYKPKR